MINDLVRQLILGLLAKGVREGDTEIAAAFWDLQYILKYVLHPPPKLHLPIPLPDPSPEAFRVYGDVIGALVNTVAGDPSPQPSLVALRDRGIRLAAAKALTGRLTTALEGLKKEVATLER